MNKNVVYPQYRKYANNQAYFKILTPTQWEEIQVIGTNYMFHTFTVKILPDRNYINDLTFDYEKHWEVIKAEEYEIVKSSIKT